MKINYHLLTIFWIQPSSKQTTKTTPNNNRPKQLLLKASSYLSIGQYPFWILISTTILTNMWKVIRLTCVISNHELKSFQDRISSYVLRYVDTYITWYILHVLHINKYIILWPVKYQIWQCQLVWHLSYVIELLYVKWKMKMNTQDSHLNYLQDSFHDT